MPRGRLGLVKWMVLTALRCPPPRRANTRATSHAVALVLNRGWVEISTCMVCHVDAGCQAHVLYMCLASLRKGRRPCCADASPASAAAVLCQQRGLLATA